MCTGSGTVVPDLVIFSFALPFVVNGDLIEFSGDQFFLKYLLSML